MTDDVRIIKADIPDGRVETGTVQFNDDWPGLFIRGDNAAGYAFALEGVLAGRGGDFDRAIVEDLLALLSGTRVKHSAGAADACACGSTTCVMGCCTACKMPGRHCTCEPAP